MIIVWLERLVILTVLILNFQAHPALAQDFSRPANVPVRRECSPRGLIWIPEVSSSKSVDTNIADTLARQYNAQALAEQSKGNFQAAIELVGKAFAAIQNDPMRSNETTFLLTVNAINLADAQNLLSKAQEIAAACLDYVRSNQFDDLAIFTALRINAIVASRLGQSAKALDYSEQALRELSRIGSTDAVAYARQYSDIAAIHQQAGRYAQAVDNYTNAVSSLRGRDDEQLYARAVSGLGTAYAALGRFQDAERALRQLVGPSAPPVTIPSSASTIIESVAQLGEVYLSLDRNKEALQEFDRAMILARGTIGDDQLIVARILHDRSYARERTGDSIGSEQDIAKALDIRSRRLGPNHRYTLMTLAIQAERYANRREYSTAERLLSQYLTAVVTSVGENHPDAAVAYARLGRVYLMDSNWAAANDVYSHATAIYARRLESGWTSETGPLLEDAILTGSALKDSFLYSVQAAYRFAKQEPDRQTQLWEQAFINSQWASISSASNSLALMSARMAAPAPAVASLVNALQASDEQLRVVNDSLISEYLKSKVQQSSKKLQELSDERTRLEAQLANQNRELNRQFRQYATYVRPTPVSVKEVQDALSESEVVLFYVMNPLYQDKAADIASLDASFVFLISKHELHVEELDIRAMSIRAISEALRCGLDDSYWDQKIFSNTCADLVSRPRPGPKDPLPFRLDYSYILYEKLIKPFEQLIGDKRIFYVPTGTLQKIPLQVLVTAKPTVDVSDKYEDLRGIRWLGLERTISVLPAVRSLVQLRSQTSTQSDQAHPFLGFGDPALTACWPAAATQECGRGGTVNGTMLASRDRSRGPKQLANPSLQENVRKFVRSMCSLPEANLELTCIANQLGATKDDLYLGSSMTKRRLFDLNKSGALQKYKIIHFATHGLLASDIPSDLAIAQPALVFTPDDSSGDNGLLLASEIAGLRLNADAVVLSACNTASTSQQNLEPLSGLVQSFFYAGAHSMLVTHWAVDTDVAVAIATSAVRAGQSGRASSMAEGLRAGMISIQADPRRKEFAHPSTWAPFIHVGAN